MAKTARRLLSLAAGDTSVECLQADDDWDDAGQLYPYASRTPWDDMVQEGTYNVLRGFTQVWRTCLLRCSASQQHDAQCAAHRQGALRGVWSQPTLPQPRPPRRDFIPGSVRLLPPRAGRVEELDQRGMRVLHGHSGQLGQPVPGGGLPVQPAGQHAAHQPGLPEQRGAAHQPVLAAALAAATAAAPLAGTSALNAARPAPLARVRGRVARCLTGPAGGWWAASASAAAGAQQLRLRQPL